MLLFLLLGFLHLPPASAEESPKPIVCFGDSYTKGRGARPSESYPGLLAEKLGTTVVNAGITGQTAGEALERLETDVLSKNPRLVIVEFGVNEAYRGYPVEEALENLETMVRRIRGRKIAVILVGVRFREFQENFDAGLREISNRNQTGLVLNVLEGILDNPSLRSDVFHPNAQGYRKMAERILPEVEKELSRLD